MGVAPVCAMTAARRARAIKKFPELKTWIGTLAQYDHKNARRAWIASSRMWVKRYCGEEDEDKEDEEKRRKLPVVDMRWATYERTKKWEASWAYLDSGFGVTVWASLKIIPVQHRPQQVQLGRGLCTLSLCRTRGLWTASKRAKRGIIGKRHKKECPCCGVVGGDGETVEHLLVECRKWEEERERCMGEIISDIATMGVVEQKEVVILLLGGECGGRRVETWLPSSTTSEAITCGAFQVARYLKCIRSERATVLRQIKHQDLGIGSSD